MQDGNIDDPNSTTGLQINAPHTEPADVSAEPPQPVVKSDSVGHRPVGDTSEAPALKKPRFVQAELVSVPPQSVERGSSSQSQDVSEAIELTKKEPLQLEELGREPSTQLQEVGHDTLEVADLPTFKPEDQLTEAPILMDSMPFTPLEPHASDAEQFMDLMVGSAVDEALDHFQRIGSEPEFTGAILTETITTATTVIEEETIIMTETLVTEAEPQNMDEAEEGEIVAEVVEDVTTPVEVMASPDPSGHEGKVHQPETISVTEVVEVSTLATPVDAERAPEGAEAAGTSNAPVEPEVTNPL